MPVRLGPAADLPSAPEGHGVSEADGRHRALTLPKGGEFGTPVRFREGRPAAKIGQI